ncbi:MAG: hypothetical protein Q8R08_01040 [bacterium]|nr:hypothetical protein [bacterium]
MPAHQPIYYGSLNIDKEGSLVAVVSLHPLRPYRMEEYFCTLVLISRSGLKETLEEIASAFSRNCVIPPEKHLTVFVVGVFTRGDVPERDPSVLPDHFTTQEYEGPDDYHKFWREHPELVVLVWNGSIRFADAL